jgi:hypothetical protein
MQNNILDLLPYCKTETQKEYIRAYSECGSLYKTAKHLSINKRTIERAIQKVKSYAASKGYSPEHGMTQTVPDPFIVKGVSTLYNGDGQISAQWVKSSIDQERHVELMREVVSAMSEDIKREKPVKQPLKHLNDKLLNTYIITDYHLGMKSWAEETGEDWDLKIAEDLLTKWFAAAIKQSPDASVGLLNLLGDFIHWDGLDAVTPSSGHLLDADTRFQLVVRVAIRVIRKVIRMLLEKHDKVHVVIAEGNHDPAASIWLRELLPALYEDEPRVYVDRSADPYYCYEHGLTAVMMHHGHKRKMDSLDTVLAAKFREVFGRTKFVYAHTGHYHHNKTNETNLMTVEQHRTLAASDAYASRGGWMSGRDAKVITYHSDFGEVSRITVSPYAVQ